MLIRNNLFFVNWLVYSISSVSKENNGYILAVECDLSVFCGEKNVS